MKKAIFLYWHGLGDVIILSPVLRELHRQGYIVDLICRKSVKTSGLLDTCPYVNDLIIVENPWRSSLGFAKQAKKNVDLLKKISPNYKWAGGATHVGGFSDKIKRNFKEANLTTDDYSLEIFIPKKIDKEVSKYVAKKYPNGFIFNHTMIEFHKIHNWDSKKWIKKSLPNLPIVDTGLGGDYYMKWPDIRYTFALLKRANHRVLSSSVMVHACDAMNLQMDVINYGKKDRKVWPYNQDLVKRIREQDKWLKNQD